MTPAELEDDIRHKAAMLNVSVFFDVPPYEAYYTPALAALHVQEIRNWGVKRSPEGMVDLDTTAETTYFVALHELGHAATLPPEAALSTYFYSLSEENILTNEALAWKWALDNSVIPVNDKMREMATAALEHYRHWSLDLHAKVFPPEQWQRTMNELSDLARAA